MEPGFEENAMGSTGVFVLQAWHEKQRVKEFGGAEEGAWASLAFRELCLCRGQVWEEKGGRPRPWSTTWSLDAISTAGFGGG